MASILDPPEGVPWPIWLVLLFLWTAPFWGVRLLAFLRDWHSYRDERRR